MKKVFIYLLLIFNIFVLFGCNSIKQYEGTNINKLTYERINGMSDSAVTYVLDFKENQYLTANYILSEEIEPEYILKKSFTEKDEKIFINNCYTYGLFEINENYFDNGDDDAGEWNLLIEYEDGSIKKSTGSNASPEDVFNKCSTAFYDLCGEEILGILPDYYIYPPEITSHFFDYTIKDTESEYQGVSSMMTAKIVRANYKWNNHESLDNNLYLINESIKDQNEFEIKYNYKLKLLTGPYDCKEKFYRITIKEYNYNSELTNEKIIYNGRWFDKIEIDLELFKIYVYELWYIDGDYVQYTFSTYCNL